MVLQNINKNQFLLPPVDSFIYLFIFSMCFSLQKKSFYFTLIKTKTCRLCPLVAHVWQRFDQHCHLLWRLCDGRSTLWQPIVQMAASPWLLSQFSHGRVEVLQFGAGFAAQAVLGARLSPERSNITTCHTYCIPCTNVNSKETPVMDAASDIPTALLALS